MQKEKEWEIMILTEAQAKLFYDLWTPLLDFVNQKYTLHKEFYGMDWKSVYKLIC